MIFDIVMIFLLNLQISVISMLETSTLVTSDPCDGVSVCENDYILLIGVKHSIILAS